MPTPTKITETATGKEQSGYLEELRDPAAGTGAESTTSSTPRPFVPIPQPNPVSDEIDPILISLVDLRSGDLQRIRTALSTNHPLPHELVPVVIGLLSDERVATEVLKALSHVAPAHTGALLDAVLHSRHQRAVRTRICHLLGRLPTQRCADGLLLLLTDGDFEIRVRAAASLLLICRQNPKIEVPREVVFAAAKAESATCWQLWRNRRSYGDSITGEAALDSRQGRIVLQGINCIATLLMVVLDRKSLKLAIGAVMSGHAHSHGTGLEYLESVLPPDLLRELRPLLMDDILTRGSSRLFGVVLVETIAGVPQPYTDLKELRAHVDTLRRRAPRKQARPM